MRADLRGAATALTFAAAAASVAYTAFAIVRLTAFGRSLRHEHEQHSRGADSASPELALPRPAITVLKPVRGLEPQLAQNLRSFCAQNYPSFDVVLGVRDPGDPAIPVLRRIAAEFPSRATVVVGDGTARCRNPKIATLLPTIAHATGEIVVIADSDMRVTPDYLDAVAEAFADERVGAATALYRGEPAASEAPGSGFASTLGAMWITEQFAPSVLVATALEPLAYCFGSTMAVRRSVLDAIGGLAALGDHLADDHRLGNLVAARGHTVALLRYVVTNVVAERSLRGLIEHEVRWARTIRSVRPASYPGILLTYPVPLALAHAALARNKYRARTLLIIAMTARVVLHFTANKALGAPDDALGSGNAIGAKHRPPSFRLAPVRDALGIAAWTLGLRGRGVRWRDDALCMEASGELTPPG